MRNRITKKLKCKKGGILEFMIGFMLVLMFVMIIFTILPVFIKKQRMNTVVTQYTNYIEAVGEIGIEADAELERLLAVYNLNIDTVAYDAEYMSGSKKIQLANKFEITITSKEYIGIGTNGFIKVPVTLTSKSTGRSEVYWK